MYTSKFKILQNKKREYRDGIKSKETRLEVHNACVGIYHGGVLSQYVHIDYITQALYCRIRVASAHFTL